MVVVGGRGAVAMVGPWSSSHRKKGNQNRSAMSDKKMFWWICNKKRNRCCSVLRYSLQYKSVPQGITRDVAVTHDRNHYRVLEIDIPNKRVIEILDDKYVKADLPAIVEDNCSHLTPLQREIAL